MAGAPTIIFWGAGATASLGIPTSDKQSECIAELAVEDSELQSRVEKAVGTFRSNAFTDLLNILGDGGQQHDVSGDALAAMGRSWRSQDNDELHRRIMELRTLFDWPALQAVVRSCPGSRYTKRRRSFKITDLFNVLDLHGQSGHGFHAREEGFLSSQRVAGAKNTLKMLLQAMFYVKWQQCRVENRSKLDLHYRFAVALGQRMQRRGLELAGEKYEGQEFYLGDVGFASMNYDPVGLWCQYVANRDLNGSPTVPHIGAPASKIELFHDHAHFVAGARVAKEPRLWHPMNESSIQRLNEAGHRIRVTKFLLPHGCICWRECPKCGKLSSYMGNSWKVDSKTLIPPPPLRAFLPEGEDRSDGKPQERKRWLEGAVDARECVHCETLTYTQDTPTIMQSNLKTPPPSFIQEIQRDLRVLVANAKHIVLLGYSLPPDDVIYRAFFASYLGDSSGTASDEVKCTVVDWKEGHARWIGPAELDRMPELSEKSAVGAAIDIFGPDNVRFYGGGFPRVCMAGDGMTPDTLERLFTWSSR